MRSLGRPERKENFESLEGLQGEGEFGEPGGCRERRAGGGLEGRRGEGGGAGVVGPGGRRTRGNTAVRATICQALTVYKAICITGVISHSYNSARQVFNHILQLRKMSFKGVAQVSTALRIYTKPEHPIREGEGGLQEGSRNRS